MVDRADETTNLSKAGLIASALLALGIASGGYLIGNGLIKARHADRSVTVRGLAERDVTADLATWTLSYSAQGSDIAPLQAQIERDTSIIRNFFQQRDFKADELAVAGVNVSQYRNNSGSLNTTVSQRIQVRTSDVARMQRAFSDQFELVKQGIALQENSGVVYNFTRLNDVKPEMIAAATKDARAGAEQFAKDSGAKIGDIKQATQGYFSIGARDGESYGSGSDSPYQKVRVVTTIDFFIN